MRTSPHRSLFACAILLLVTSTVESTQGADATWKQADGPLKTRWAKDVTPANALPEYPRPQMVRKQWMSLNGVWQFAAAKEGEQPPTGKDLAEQVLVPYPIESSLSGIMRHEDRMWYRRTFEVPKDWAGKHVLLHLDAVNWESTVYFNGRRLGTHKGGYDAYGFDVTRFLNPEGPQELIVNAIDTPDEGNHARGKLTMKPGGIFYTPASGIWQTVWIEPVDKGFIENIRAEPDIDHGTVKVIVKGIGDRLTLGQIEVLDGDKVVATQASGASDGADLESTLKIPDAKLWSPDSPFLYGLRVHLLCKGAESDAVESYFGMRKISMAKDEKGLNRILLNNKFVFQAGPLDQGFWPDGIYTAPTDKALKYDIEITKKLGFNATRKHVKVEPERWYYWCDKLGLIVWQDMPSMRDKPDDAQAKQFERELRRMIESRRNHPSIVMWVVFNEGWGEHDVPRLTAAVKEMDPTRLVSNASGWTDMNVGDIVDMHHYPDPSMPKPEESRAAVLGEFGGLGLGIEGHTWSTKSWSYRGVGGPEQLTSAYERMLAKAWRLKDRGLNAVIYTQITDVETEMNGLLTYDRQVVKPDVQRMAAINSGHIEQFPEPKVIVATSEEKPAQWHYTLDKPADDWAKSAFDDSAWKQGPGGFGTAGTPGAVIGTTWNTHDIWIRREIDLPETKLADPQLRLHHDDDVEVYLNGVLAFKEAGYVGEYQPFPVSPEARAALKPGKNVIAIHCHQNAGGQFIDAGIVDGK
ncbi:MAG: beta-galactosidase/beta-glucuronidase [Phycisphaerales bacterium]|nr:beta-galactosidase/beta-glucuronidase [Phycisphaerales bacterium]